MGRSSLFLCSNGQQCLKASGGKQYYGNSFVVGEIVELKKWSRLWQTKDPAELSRVDSVPRNNW